jgi:F420-non-reducing hydrogenase small subunit
MSKPKIAFYWAGSCGGCEVAVVDLGEKIYDVVDAFDIVFWPVAMDTKYDDIHNLEDGEIEVCFFNGCIRNEENEEIARLLRQKSKVMIAFGSCSHLGGIPGLGNLSSRDETLDYVYRKTPVSGNEEGKMPCTTCVKDGNTIDLPALRKEVSALDDVVDVDYYIPGCPPPLPVIETAVAALMSGELPRKGAVLSSEKTVCDECDKEKREKMVAKARRIYDDEVDPTRCLLEQGIPCMGPATRGGCEAACPSANMPCTGCMGPPPASQEQGSRMVTAMTSLIGVENEREATQEEVRESLASLRDPVGFFYMYSLPKSFLRRRYNDE